jgi:hypothetical protein
MQKQKAKTGSPSGDKFSLTPSATLFFLSFSVFSVLSVVKVFG